MLINWFIVALLAVLIDLGITSPFRSADGTSPSTAPNLATASATPFANTTRPQPRHYAGSGWATFHDDTACTLNGGQPVSVSNPGCLGEYGRHSVWFNPGVTDEGMYAYSLVLTPGDACDCQVECIDLIDYGASWEYCFDLSGHAFATSFRFVEGKCGPDNCAVGSGLYG